MPSLAEYFVDLGIKGNTKVKDALVDTQMGLQKTARMSLEAKAGILAAVYGLERLTAGAVGSAVDLQSFAGATGLSTESLQRWQYMARMNNVTGEELAGTIKGLQTAQAQMALHGNAPEGFAWFGLDPTDNTLSMLDKIQKKIRDVRGNPRDIAIARTMLATLGFSDNMFAMMRTGTMSLAGFRKELQLTTRDREGLLELNRDWQRLWMTVEATTQKTLADPILGGAIRGTVKEMTNVVLGFSDAIKTVRDVIHHSKADFSGFEKGMKYIGIAIAAALAPIAPYTAALIALAAILDDFHKYKAGQPSMIGAVGSSPIGQDYKKNGFWSSAWTAMTTPDPNLKPTQENTPEEMAKYRAGLMSLVGLTPNVELTQHFHGIKERDMPERAGREASRALGRISGNK